MLRGLRGAMLGLLSSLSCSVKALGCGFVRSPVLEGFATKVTVMLLAYNIAVMVRLEQQNSKS